MAIFGWLFFEIFSSQNIQMRLYYYIVTSFLTCCTKFVFFGNQKSKMATTTGQVLT